MLPSDFLPRHKHDNSNLHEIIPILFNMQNILQSRYYSIDEEKEGKYLVQKKLQATSSGIGLLEVLCIGKGLDPNIRPEKEVIKPLIVSKVKILSQVKPKPGQGRAGIKQKNKIPVSVLLYRPIIHLKEKLISQQPQNLVQPKITLTVPISESS